MSSFLRIIATDLRAFRHCPTAWVCLPLIACCALLPFINLGVTPFWADESIAVLPAHNIHFDLLPTSPYDLDVMAWQLKYGLWDPATPLYRYSVAAFTALTGFSEGTARAFSVIMGLASMVPFYALVRKLERRRMALLSLTFLVTSPSFMLQAREARHFTFVGFLALCTFYFLYTATEDREDRSRALWVVFLTATLLAQTLGYGILPIVGLFVLVNGGPWRFLRWRHVPVYLAAAVVYLAVMAVFWETLPFFHDVSCATRAECRPFYWFYLIVLYAFVAPMTGRLEEVQLGLSVLPLVFLLGLGVFVKSAVRGRQRLEKASLLLAWFFFPLVALSMNEVKFDRYLFIWVMPLCALFLAYGVRTLLSKRPFRFAPVASEIGLVLLVVFSPQLFPPPRGSESRMPSLRSGLVKYVETGLLQAPADNFELIRWQSEYLRERMRPGDVVVSSLDDASLQYYLGQFVYGFLNSRRSDEFFLGLLDKAERDGSRVWFIDSLDKWNFCLVGHPELRRIDCRVKYEKFYEKCTSPGEGEASACTRVLLE